MKSKFKIFGGVGLIIALLIFIIVMITFLLSKPYNHQENEELPMGFFFLWIAIGFAFVFYQVLTRINILNIEQNSITSKNILYRKKREFSINEIDGYKSKFEWSKGGYYELITLKKNHINLLIISSFYYSNFDEIKKLIQSRLIEL